MMTLAWPVRKTYVQHPLLGRRALLQSKCKRYQIAQTIETANAGPLIAVFVPEQKILARSRTLAAAQRACEQHYRSEQGKADAKPGKAAKASK